MLTKLHRLVQVVNEAMHSAALSASSANTLLALRVATCTGGLVHISTGAYTACTDCNLHCDGGAWW